MDGWGGIPYLQETWGAGGYPIPAGNLGVCGGGGGGESHTFRKSREPLDHPVSQCLIFSV